MIKPTLKVRLECPTYVIRPNCVCVKAIVTRNPEDQNIKFRYEWNSEELIRKGQSVNVLNDGESEITIENLPVGSFQAFVVVTECIRDEKKEVEVTCQETAEFEVYPGEQKFGTAIKIVC